MFTGMTSSARRFLYLAPLIAIALPGCASNAWDEPHATTSTAAVGATPAMVIGPNPLCHASQTCLRPDYPTQFGSGWTEVKSRSDTVELYVEMLARNRGTSPPTYNLAALATSLGSKRVAFQVGTITPSGCTAGAGRTAADGDWSFLQDWIGAGGRIDEIVLDNSYCRLLLSDTLCKASPPHALCSLDYITTEVAGYLLEMRTHLPGARLVMTDGLGWFGKPGSDYPATCGTTACGQDSLASYLGQVQSKMSSQIAEFALDFMDSVEYDAGVTNRGTDTPANSAAFVGAKGADFGRLVSADSAARGAGMQVGVYFNAFPCPNPGKAAAPCEAPAALASDWDARTRNRSVRFLADYASFSGYRAPDTFRFVFWQDFPSLTGPETGSPASGAATAFSIFRDELRAVNQRTTGGFAPANFAGFYHPDTHAFELFRASVDDPPFQAVAWGTSGGIAITGDWDGDGVDTVGMYYPATGLFYLAGSNQVSGSPSATTTPFVFGPANSGWLPVAGDWTAKGYDSIGLYDPVNSIFYLRNTNTTGVADIVATYGNPGNRYVPLTGDWDGDGRTTIGLFEKATGSFLLRNSNTTGFADVVFTSNATSAMLPIVGDWDGDGHDTPGLVQAQPTQWELDFWNTTGGGALNVSTPNARLTRPLAASTMGTMIVPLVGRWLRFY